MHRSSQCQGMRTRVSVRQPTPAKQAASVSSQWMASPVSASRASVEPSVNRQLIRVLQWHVQLLPSALLTPPVWPVALASLDTQEAQPLHAQRLTGVPVLNASMATVLTAAPTSSAPAHLAGKVPPARRMSQSVPPSPVSMGAHALSCLAASPAPVLLVGLDSPATRTLMSVQATLVGMECVATLPAPTSVRAIQVGAGKTAT